jgi:cell division protein FtsB
MLLVLVAVAGLLLVELLLSDDGYRKTLKLRQAVAEQQALNTELRQRNAALDAEVINLKRGRAAAEERARTDLGLIAPGETFYQVIATKEP